MPTLEKSLESSEIKDRQAIFERHYCRFWADVGSIVHFKRPKRNNVPWKVVEIETDVTKMKWSHGGLTPNYIKLTVDPKLVRKGQPTEVWTCENKLRPSAPRLTIARKEYPDSECEMTVRDGRTAKVHVPTGKVVRYYE